MSPWLLLKGVCLFQTNGALPVWQSQAIRQCRGQKESCPGVVSLWELYVFVATWLTNFFSACHIAESPHFRRSLSLSISSIQLAGRSRTLARFSPHSFEVSLIPRQATQESGSIPQLL